MILGRETSVDCFRIVPHFLDRMAFFVLSIFASEPPEVTGGPPHLLTAGLLNQIVGH